jgi:RNA polymerase sigma-70 factor (ECF subfamily)
MTTRAQPDPKDELIPTRSSLLRRVKDWEDRKSWQEFFDTYWRPVYGFAVKSGLTPAEAEDATQNTFIAVARRMKEFQYDRAVGSFKGWLLHTARWKINDQRRKRLAAVAAKSHSDDGTPCTAAIERVPDPNSVQEAAIWDEEWERNLLEAALERVKQRVNPKDYQIYGLAVVKGRSVKDVMQMLRVTRCQVYNARCRVARKVKQAVAHLKNQTL